jgi:putative tricarboxylic transport membrane protein
MKTLNQSSLMIMLALVLSIGLGTAYGASKFPEKPITLVVGSAPGSGSDITARITSATIEKHKLLPQPIVVENKPGGNMAVAMAYVAGKKGDPYFLMATTITQILSPLQGLTSITYKDVTPICNLSYDEVLLLTNVNSKFKSVKDLVDYAKANPETATMGGSMFGSVNSIDTYRLEQVAGIKLKYVAFGGGGDAVVALLGSHVDLALIQPLEALELMKANKVRALGVLTEKRLPFLPDIPTLKEQGINTIAVGMNRGVIAPPGIPEDARKVLEEAFFKFSKTEEYKKFHKDNSIIEGFLDSAAFGKYMDRKSQEFALMLKEMGFKKK